MSFQSVPCMSTGTNLNNRQVYKAFTSFIIPQPSAQPNVLVNVKERTQAQQLFIPVLVLVVFSLDKEILKWLSICPKYSHKLPKSFSVTTEKIRKQKHRPKIGKLFYSDDTRKTETKDKQRKYRLGSLFQVENGKVDLSECTKLTVDERLVASDPDMFGYRTFVVIKALDHGAKFRRSRSYRCEQT